VSIRAALRRVPAPHSRAGSSVVGRELTKGTLRFTADSPIPAAPVRKIVKARIQEIGTAGSGHAGGRKGLVMALSSP
jgi:hypothetical protein